MMKHLCLALVILTRFGAFSGQPMSSCRDLDSSACALFQKAKSDLCTEDAFAHGTCKRFCGNCPLECYMCPTPVLDPRDCNTTIACADDQTCMMKHLKSRDGHHEYIMTCEAKDVCEGLTLGFQSPNYIDIIGKRAVTGSDDVDDSSDLQRYDRDVSISCCDTDFCNLPMTTTTSAPTSPGPFPYGCNRDIVFVLDDSGSVGSNNFHHALDFVRKIISQLMIGPNKSQIALISYSTHAKIEWYLDSYSTKQEVLNAIANVHYKGGSTRTHEALEAVRTQILTLAKGDRPLAYNVVVVLTDGQSNNRNDTITEAQKLQTKSDDVISIAIGSGINSQEIAAIATDGHHVFDLHSYQDLANISSNILQIICNA